MVFRRQDVVNVFVQRRVPRRARDAHDRHGAAPLLVAQRRRQEERRVTEVVAVRLVVDHAEGLAALVPFDRKPRLFVALCRRRRRRFFAVSLFLRGFLRLLAVYESVLANFLGFKDDLLIVVVREIFS